MNSNKNKPSPLKGKVKVFIKGTAFTNPDIIKFILRDKEGAEFVGKEDIRSAVELSLSQVEDLYHKFPKGKIWRLNADEICDMIEEYIKKILTDNFEDVMR